MLPCRQLRYAMAPYNQGLCRASQIVKSLHHSLFQHPRLKLESQSHRSLPLAPHSPLHHSSHLCLAALMEWLWKLVEVETSFWLMAPAQSSYFKHTLSLHHQIHATSHKICYDQRLAAWACIEDELSSCLCANIPLAVALRCITLNAKTVEVEVLVDDTMRNSCASGYLAATYLGCKITHATPSCISLLPHLF